MTEYEQQRALVRPPKVARKTHRVWFGETVGPHHVKSEDFLTHELLSANRTLKREETVSHSESR